MDKLHPRPHANRSAARTRPQQLHQRRPGALLCVEFYDDTADEPAAATSKRSNSDLEERSLGYHFHRAIELADQARIWSLREAALGLSMAMKDDAKSISFVEDTAVAPEQSARLHRPLPRHHSQARNNSRHLRARIRRMPARPARSST